MTLVTNRKRAMLASIAAIAVLCAIQGIRMLNRTPIDDFEPKAGMKPEEVKAILGEPDYQYTYSDSGDLIPGERFRGRHYLGYGDYRSPPPEGIRKFHLVLRFESWKVSDKSGRIIEDHPMQLDSWDRDARP